MSSTRSPFPKAPAIDRQILVVTHGSPSHPVSQEIAVRDLACRLGKVMPGAELRGATLAAKGALDRAVDGLVHPIVVPWFMSDGWFVGTHLPKRLRLAGLQSWDAVVPMGLMRGMGALMAQKVLARLGAEGWDAEQTTVILAAHGSPSSDRPRLATEAAAAALTRHVSLKAIRPCYVDEAPAIRDAACVQGPAIVLPFFAARGGHVTEDVPNELDAAGFTGPVLDPIGTWPETPQIAMHAIAGMALTEDA